MNPLIIREGLRQFGPRSHIRPSQRHFRLTECRGDLVPERLIGHSGLLIWLVPKRAMARRTHARLLLNAAAWNPFMTAPVTTKSHDRNGDPSHAASNRGELYPKNIDL